LTRLQVLEKQNKDLRIRLENRQGKAELSLIVTENERNELKDQIRKKDIIIAMLQKEISALTQELDRAKDLRAETMQDRIDEAVAKAVSDATAPLLEELDKAYLEIGRLKAIIGKDSSNSSKPPRTNNFKQVPNSREPSGRPKGGQIGHPGHRLALPENMDELERKGIIKTQVIDHTGGSGEYISRYVIDIEVVTTVTEHRYAVNAQIPKNLYNEVSYGDNIKAMSVILLNEGTIAEKRLADILEGLTQGVITISPATLEKFQAQFAEKLESSGELDAIKEDLLNGEVLHTDDTSLRCAETIEYLEDGTQITHTADKKSFKATIRTHSNEQSTFYTVNPKKDMEGIERDGILPKFVGILSHDHESKFNHYGKQNSHCGTHLLRELKGLRDLQMIPWAGIMRAHIAAINNYKNKDLEKGSTACDPVVLASFEEKYDNLLEQGRLQHGQMRKNELGYKEFNAMLNRLTKYKDNYLLFIRDYKAPFSNNLSERDLRAEKTKEKVSLLFRSWKGINIHAQIRSFVSTMKKRNMDLFSGITKVINSIPVLTIAK